MTVYRLFRRYGMGHLLQGRCHAVRVGCMRVRRTVRKLGVGPLAGARVRCVALPAILEGLDEPLRVEEDERLSAGDDRGAHHRDVAFHDGPNGGRNNVPYPCR